MVFEADSNLKCKSIENNQDGKKHRPKNTAPNIADFQIFHTFTTCFQLGLLNDLNFFYKFSHDFLNYYHERSEE